MLTPHRGLCWWFIVLTGCFAAALGVFIRTVPPLARNHSGVNDHEDDGHLFQRVLLLALIYYLTIVEIRRSPFVFFTAAAVLFFMGAGTCRLALSYRSHHLRVADRCRSS